MLTLNFKALELSKLPPSTLKEKCEQKQLGGIILHLCLLQGNSRATHKCSEDGVEDELPCRTGILAGNRSDAV